MRTRTRVKFCGITRPEDARIAASLGVDAVGLVFVEASPRCVSVDQARAICESLPPMVEIVGLFMNTPAERIESLIGALPLSVLQFHGAESPRECARFGRPWWKALPMASPERIQYRGWRGARALLLDGHAPGQMGGTGKRFDWNAFTPPPRPWILAGGLDPDTIVDAVRRLRPPAVDVSSGIESAPGIKDATLMQRFIANLESTDTENHVHG
ncbi:MAG: phosphoribosylanthranilate isomerase [Wenzhouxiangellaceae bacterium]